LFQPNLITIFHSLFTCILVPKTLSAFSITSAGHGDPAITPGNIHVIVITNIKVETISQVALQQA